MRNHVLDIFKIIGIIIVCLLHTTWFPMLHHGYLPVEFFFIVSGYFIYKATQKSYGIRAFLNKKIERLYLPYFLALLVFIALAWYKPNLFKEFDFWSSILFCSTLLQFPGMPDLFGAEKVIGLCGPAWYLSVLFYGGFILFVLLKYTKRTFHITILSVITICVYTHMLITGSVEHFYNVGIINLPIFRGLASMFLGCLLAMPEFKYFINRSISKYAVKTLLNALTILAIPAVTILMFTPNHVPVLAVPLFFIIITGVMTPGLFINNLNALPIFAKITIPDLSLEMLLLHKATIYPSVIFCEKIGQLYNMPVKVMIFLSITIVASLILKRFVNKILDFKRFSEPATLGIK